MEKDNKYFDVCIVQACKAFAMGEVPVGCVIVDAATGDIIAKAYNTSEAKRNPLKHAEMLAIERATRKVGKNLSGCIAYVSLAPCLMCATAFSYARISAVYYCAVDLKTGVENAEKCKRIFQIDKNLYPTQFKFVQCSNSVDSEKLLKNFFKGVRAKNTE